MQEKGDYEAARAAADVVISRRFYYDHGVAAAMENRGVVAEWDRKTQRMTIWDTTQAPIPIRNGLAGMLGLSESQVRVIAPFIGGGFGPKIMMFYPEEVLLPWISMKLDRPIKWIEDRRENFMATTHERDQVHWSEIAVRKDGRVLGVKDSFIHDTGAYDTYGLTCPINSQCTLLGCYDIPAYHSEFKVVFTNKMFVMPFRGAGRQHGVFVMERLLDLAARELGMDRNEIRRLNYIPPDKFPYNNEIIYQDFAPLVYDSGNYEPALDKALEMIGYEQFINEEQPQLRAEGRHVGIGVVSYVEGTGIGPYEGARVQIEATGKVNVATGIGTQGQGHFTSYAQIVADQVGVDVADIHLVTGDTDRFHWGTGTFASRGAVVAGNAIHAAAVGVRQKSWLSPAASWKRRKKTWKSSMASCATPNIPIFRFPSRNWRRRRIRCAGRLYPAPNRVWKPPTTSGRTRRHRQRRPCHDRRSRSRDGHAEDLRYVTVHDCGNMINPLIVDGQVQGGIAQGIGNAFYEKIVYDDNGQLLNASLMDYLLPTSMEVPTMELDHIETPSPLNPLGTKGAGEAGAIPVGALFAQAVEDALADHNLEILEIPLSPNRLFELMQEAKKK